jgi:hypothetical protein
VGVITVNKTIRLIILSAILGLSTFIPLSYASDIAPQNGQIQLASLAFHSYEGVCCPNVGCCGSGEGHACKVKHVHSKHHHKHHRKHHHKRHYKHIKKSYACPCQDS